MAEAETAYFTSQLDKVYPYSGGLFVTFCDD